MKRRATRRVAVPLDVTVTIEHGPASTEFILALAEERVVALETAMAEAARRA